MENSLGESPMDMSRRELLTASALLLAGAKTGIAAANAAAVPNATIGVAAAPSAANPVILCWNENPYGPSPAARAVIGSTISQACRYPDEEIDQLTADLARAEKMPADHIV